MTATQMTDYPVAGYHNPNVPESDPNKIVIETHCVVPDNKREISPILKRRVKIAGLLSALILYRLMVVAVIISLGTYAYNIKVRNFTLEQVYRTTWALTVVSIIMILVELGVVLLGITYYSRKKDK